MCPNFREKSFLVDQITMIWYVDSKTCDSFQRTCWLVPFCLTNEKLIDEKISTHFDELTSYHPKLHALILKMRKVVTKQPPVIMQQLIFALSDAKLLIEKDGKCKTCNAFMHL